MTDLNIKDGALVPPNTPPSNSSLLPAGTDAFKPQPTVNFGTPTAPTATAAPTPASPITPPAPTPPVTPQIPPPAAPTAAVTTPVTPPATSSPPTSTPTTPPQGMSDADYKAFKQANPTVEPTSEDVQRGQLADAQALRTQQAQEYFDLGKKVSDTITSIQNGSIPLSAGETAQLDGLKNQWETAINQQLQANQNYTTGAKMLAARNGTMQYAPGVYMSDIQKTITDGATKITSLMTQEASAVATLTQSLKDNDIKAVQESWNAYKDASTARTNALASTIKDTQDAITAAQAQADKQQTYELDVAKFNQTGDQNAFDNALKAEQEAESERHNKATEAIDSFKAGQGAGGNTTGVTQSAQLTPSGNPDPVSQKQVLDQITQRYGPMTAQAIQGLANYTLNPSDWSSRAGTKGLSRADAVAMAQMYDPTYSDTNYAIRASYLKSLSSTQGGTIGNAVNAANKSINHLTAFVTSMNTLGNSFSSTLNAFDNAVTLNQTQRKNIAAAQTEGLGVAEELAKFFKGSGTVDVASIDAWKGQLSTNASPADVKGLTQGAITLLAGQLETLTEQYQQTMGKAPETDFLNTSARASLSNLKNQGYEVNIPGIYYTDKSAYVKNDPDAQANMTAAVDALTHAGLPVTPENILQAAQSLGSVSPPQAFNSVGSDTQQASNIQIPQNTLAYANNNPGNLRFAGQDGASEGKGGFASFSSPQEGFNALQNQIKLDAGRGLSLADFISKFAPPSENDTQNYIQQIASATSTNPTTPISQIPVDVLAKAIAHKESGTLTS